MYCMYVRTHCGNYGISLPHFFFSNQRFPKELDEKKLRGSEFLVFSKIVDFTEFTYDQKL